MQCLFLFISRPLVRFSFVKLICINLVLLYHTKLAMNYLKEGIEKNRELTLNRKEQGINSEV